MSNFDFLKDYDNTLWKLGNRIEAQVNTSPSGVKADATTFLEHILKELLTLAGLKYNSRKPFTDQVDAVFRSDLKMSNAYRERIKSAYNYRNKIHDEFDEIEKHEFQDAVQLHEKLFYIAKKFYRDYNEDYDEYKGVPDYKPLEIDFSDEEVELVKVPDFNEIIDIRYDYCIICGKPNHSNYSIYCPDCNRIIDNANNFISLRNSFGKDAKFTKEDLIEYGIPEGYITQFINSMVKQDMLKVKGRFITFNSMHLDEYLAKIDTYIYIGELITRFREDKLSPAQIKDTLEYRHGSFRQEPYYQFYKIINDEIINKFEKDLLTTEDIQSSIEYTTITQKELRRWYQIQLGHYNRGKINESFVKFNELLMEDYIDLKRQGILEKEIKKRLHVNDEVYEFWTRNNKEFIDEIDDIKKELILRALNEGKTREEAIEIAGVTQKEYDDLVKYSDFKGDKFSQNRNRELEARKEKFIVYLKTNDIETSAKLAKITVDDFYEWYDHDITSEFYINTTNVLMDRYLNVRRTGKTKSESAKEIGLEEKYVDYWLTRSLEIYDKFKDRNIKVTVDLIYEGFVNGKSKKDIAEMADISVNMLNSYLKLGQRGYGTYKKLYDYYEEEVIPRQLDRFLDEVKNKPHKKALELSELSQDELDECCELGSKGDERYKGFYIRYCDLKLNIFLTNIRKGKSKSKALRNADLTQNEVDEYYNSGKNGDEQFTEFYKSYYEIKLDLYVKNIIKGKSKSKALEISDFTEDELQSDIDDVIFDKQFNIVVKALKQDLTTKQAAKKANVSIDDIFDWFLKGKNGDEKFKDFYELYYDGYVLPGAKIVQRTLNDGIPLGAVLNKFKKHFTKEDYEFWSKYGYMKQAREELEDEEDDEPEDE